MGCKLPGLLFTPSPRLSPAQFRSLLSELSSYISSVPGSRPIFLLSLGWECCSHQGLRSASSRKDLSSTPTLLHNPALPRRPPSALLPSRSLPVFIFLGWGSPPCPTELLTAAGAGATGPSSPSTLAVPFLSLLISWANGGGGREQRGR